MFKIAFTHKQLYINYTDTRVLIQYLQKRIQLCNRHLTGTVQSMLVRGHSLSRTNSRIGDNLGFHYLKSCNFVPLLYIKLFTCISNHWLELIILSQSYYNPVKCKTKTITSTHELSSLRTGLPIGTEHESRPKSRSVHHRLPSHTPLDKVSRGLLPLTSGFTMGR